MATIDMESSAMLAAQLMGNNVAKHQHTGPRLTFHDVSCFVPLKGSRKKVILDHIRFVIKKLVRSYTAQLTYIWPTPLS